MSAYCAVADLLAGGLRQAYIDELSDVDALIERASSRIDSYLRGRYDLPLSAPYPAEVVDICVQMTVYYALHSLGWDPQTGPDAAVMHAFEDAKSRLRDFAAGKCSLDITADATATAHEGGPKVYSIPRDCGIRNDGRI